MVEGGLKCVKYLLFIFNLLFFISGLLLIAVGGVIWANFNHFFGNFGGSASAAILLIVVGSVIFVVAFFGCCGAIRENYCMIVTFAAFLCLILILEVAAAIAAFAMRNRLRAVVEQVLGSNIVKYHEDNDITMSWDIMQSELKCCGTVNYTNWRSNSHLNMLESVPTSCCHDPPIQCNVTGMAAAPQEYAEQFIYTSGCIDAMSEWAMAKVFIIGGVAAGLTFVQVLGIILAICLARDIKVKFEYV